MIKNVTGKPDGWESENNFVDEGVDYDFFNREKEVKRKVFRGVLCSGALFI